MTFENYVLEGYQKELYARDHQLIRHINRISKYALDIPIAIFGGLLAIPITVCAGIALKLESAGPVFYKPIRIGEDGKPIMLHKLRTMYDNAREYLEVRMKEGYESSEQYYIEKQRLITRTGRFLRKYSLDESTQFWDVLLDRLSLVGPRPLHPHEVDNLPDYAKERFCCPAGMTGNWQISDRPSPEKRIKMDIDYARRYNSEWILPYDLKIIFDTIGYVLMGKNS